MTTRVALVALVLAAGCASKPVYTVRLYEPGDDIQKKRTRRAGCDEDGAPARELYEPVVAFARARLLDGMRGPMLPARAYLVMPGSEHRQKRGLELVMTPRPNVGRLTIALRWGPWFSTETVYCVHFLPDAKTVVLRQSYRMSQ